MNLAAALAALTERDAIAVGLLVAGWLLTGWLTDHPPRSFPSVTVIMKHYRREWMRQMVTRQPRIFDANIMDNLRQGTTFFASACMLAIGGGLALTGNPGMLADLATGLALDSPPILVWQIKLVLVILFVTDAFLKFVWAHRLFGYCAIVMAAVPNDAADPDAYPRAAQAAEINIAAARNFNRGLRSVYFAIGALAWLAGPWALMAAAGLTVAIIVRREFASASRRVLLGQKAP